MAELSRHLKDSLFDTGVCNLFTEFIIDEIPVFVKLVKSNNSVKLILYNVNIIRMTEIDDDDTDYNLLADTHLLSLCAHNRTLPHPTDIGYQDAVVNIVTEKLRETLTSIRFDRYIGKFVKNSEINRLALDTDISNLFKDSEHIKTSPIFHSEKCCVCLEETITKTHCDHSLCFKCVINIQPTKIVPEDDCDDRFTEYELLCPCCRSELLF